MRFVSSIKFTAIAGLALLAACSGTPVPPYQPPAAAAPPHAQAPGEARAAPLAAAAQSPARNWDEYRVRAARRILQASGPEAFSGPVPDTLQSIPVLRIELHRDGSVRRIEVLRKPHFSPETVQMAMKAVHRAAPFGSVAHLPQPWQFNETFLYNEDLKFQIRSLVENQ